jgi:hypothetical protein
MIDEKALEWSGRDLGVVLIRHLLEGAEDNHRKNLSQDTPSPPGKIRTEYLPNTGLERYRYANFYQTTRRHILDDATLQGCY